MRNGVIILGILTIIAGCCEQTPKKLSINDTCENLDTLQKDKNYATAYIGEYPIKTLEEMGIIATPATYSLQCVHNVKFNNETIFITVYASVNPYGHGTFDSLFFAYEGKTHDVWLMGREISLFNPTYIKRESLIELSDYNFDGYMDVGFFNREASGMKNATYEIYLYHPEEERYYYSRELSGMANLYVDKKKKILSSFWEGGMASKIFVYGEYKWGNEKLMPIYSVHQEYNDSLQIFIRETKELQNNNWVTQIDSLKEDEASWP